MSKEEEQRKLNRRVFIQYSASASGAATGLYAVTMKTDAALADTGAKLGFGSNSDNTYPYT